MHLAPDQLGCEVGQSLDLTLSPSEFNDEIFALDPPELS